MMRGVWFRVGEVGEEKGEGGWMDGCKRSLGCVWRGFCVRLGNKDGCRGYVLIALIEACLEVNVLQCERGTCRVPMFLLIKERGLGYQKYVCINPYDSHLNPTNATNAVCATVGLCYYRFGKEN